jgi:hypothetical protein
MAILARLQSKGKTAADNILQTFNKRQIEEIYPPLNPILLQILLEELDLMGYVSIRRGQAWLTAKGEVKLKDFQNSLPKKDLKAFEQYLR